MSPILLAILPIAVKGLTSLIKRIPKIDRQDDSKRALIIRSIAALLSLGGVVGGFMLYGVNPDPANLTDIVVTLLFTFTTFIGSTGLHDLFKKKSVV